MWRGVWRAGECGENALHCKAQCVDGLSLKVLQWLMEGECG